jgi:glucose-1-phosphate adenylyltransferase
LNTATVPRTFTFILAGGKGERLDPLTRDRAKPAVPIGAVHRLIDFTLSNCFNSGLGRVHVLAQHRRESLRACLQGLKNDGSISFLCPAPGHRYRGTADAVFQNLAALEKTDCDLVLILSGDHLYRMDYRRLLDFHVKRGSEITVAATEYASDAASQFGVLETNVESQLIGFEEKPLHPKAIANRPSRSLVNMGVYVFNRSLLADLLSHHGARESAYDFGRNVLPTLVGRRGASVYNFIENGKALGTYWRDVGTVDSYYRSNMELVDQTFESSRNAWPLIRGNGLRPNVSDCQRDSLVADGALIESSAEVIRSVLSSGVHIHHLAHVEDSVLLSGVRVGAGARIVRAVIDENVHVPDAMEIGYESQKDREHGLMTDGGIVAIAANTPLTRRPLERTVMVDGRNARSTKGAR